MLSVLVRSVSRGQQVILIQTYSRLVLFILQFFIAMFPLPKRKGKVYPAKKAKDAQS